jgi:hypothetical protein
MKDKEFFEFLIIINFKFIKDLAIQSSEEG